METIHNRRHDYQQNDSQNSMITITRVLLSIVVLIVVAPCKSTIVVMNEYDRFVLKYFIRLVTSYYCSLIITRE